MSTDDNANAELTTGYATTNPTSGAQPKPEQPHARKSFTVRQLAQVKVLTDPLRQRILGAFMLEPRTTKQVALRLGEKPSKLYHHVDALSRAGLIELKETRQNRGTIEKYFQSVATHFSVDSSLFPSLPDRASRIIDEFDEVLDATRAGLFTSLDDASTPSGEGLQPVFERAVLRGPPHKIRQCREKLLAVLEECQTVCRSATADEGPPVDYAVSLFFTKGSDGGRS